MTCNPNLSWLDHAPAFTDSAALCDLRLDQALNLALRHHDCDEPPFYLANTANPLGQ